MNERLLIIYTYFYKTSNSNLCLGVFQESWQIAHAQMVIIVSKDDNDSKMSCSQLFV